MIPNVGIGDKKRLEVCLVSKTGSMPRDWYLHEASRKKRKIHAWFGLEKGINDTALHPSPFAGAARLVAFRVFVWLGTTSGYDNLRERSNTTA